MMAMMTPAGSLAGAPRGSQADVADEIQSKMWESIRIVRQMEAELRALTIGQARASEGFREEAERYRVLRSCALGGSFIDWVRLFTHSGGTSPDAIARFDAMVDRARAAEPAGGAR